VEKEERSESGLRYYIKEGDRRVISERSDEEHQGPGVRRDRRPLLCVPAADLLGSTI